MAFQPGDVIPVPMKNTTARVVAVAEHDERCTRQGECSRPDVLMVKLRADSGFVWGWFHANSLVAADNNQ